MAHGGVVPRRGPRHPEGGMVSDRPCGDGGRRRGDRSDTRGWRELDVSWAVVVALVLFIYYVLRLNYLRVADLQAQYRKDVSWHWDQMKKTLDRDIRSYKVDRFKAVRRGR